MNMTNDAEYWAGIAAEELAAAMKHHGIRFHRVDGDSDGDVSISFEELADAEALMTLAVEADDILGGLYDRATSSCLSLSHLSQMHDQGIEVSDDHAKAVIDAGWTWDIHPSMHGRRMAWHVRLDIPFADATAVAARLNQLRNGGAL